MHHMYRPRGRRPVGKKPNEPPRIQIVLQHHLRLQNDAQSRKRGFSKRKPAVHIETTAHRDALYALAVGRASVTR